MEVILVDDEDLALHSLEEVLREVCPDALIVAFSDSEEALEYLSGHSADIVFLDIEMGELSGLELVGRYRELCPSINIIFVTGYSQYTMDALKLHVSGYLMKPVRSADLRAELDNLWYPLPAQVGRVRIQTFGNFEVFVDGRPLKFPRSKCKECLAYLVDRKGAGVTYAQISTVLWEDQPASRSVQNNTHKIISDMMKALREVNAEDIILRRRMDIAVDTKKVDCDYFKASGGDLSWLDSFMGEYMINYSWAEFTLGELVEIKQKNSV